MGQAVESPRRWTDEEYLAFERAAETKNEFYGGEIFAMAGGTPNHAFIAGSLIAHLGALLQRRCIVSTSDLRLKVQHTGLYTYPDVAVICGRPEFTGDKMDNLLNPTLLAEVLSESTEAYDRGEKFRQYQTIPTLETYLLVSQDKPQIEQFRRLEKSKWEYNQASGKESLLEIPALGIKLSLAEIYANATFPSHPLRKPTGTNPTAAAV